MNGPALPAADDWKEWGVDPSWSRTLDVASHDGGTHRWHVLERRPSGSERPLGTIVCVHGNPTWSFYFRNLVKGLSGSYRTIVPEECVADKHESPHFANLYDMAVKYADVMSAKEVLAYLEGLPS
jgi:hypothetical protein